MSETEDRASRMIEQGVRADAADVVVALAGNPNTGKSTVFNRLTGLRQHTGNWPGKTVTRAVGSYHSEGRTYQLVDLPGTYSLRSTSTDEEIARNFLLFGRPDVTVVVADASRLERNLNLVLQVMEITGRCVVCLNLMDEARRRGLTVRPDLLEQELGVPVVPTSARSGDGIPALVGAIAGVAAGEVQTRPRSVGYDFGRLAGEVDGLASKLAEAAPDLPNARWAAIRLLEGDEDLGDALIRTRVPGSETADAGAVAGVVEAARALRWDLGPNFPDRLMEGLYGEAARLADRTVTKTRDGGDAEFDRRIDRIVTGRPWGPVVMVGLLAAVLWVTVTGANYPSALIASVLLDTFHPALRDLFVNAGAPWWVTGALVDGCYLALAWVVSVMLPPMAIFFPLFTLLEDLGYLPRVAFNLDGLFRRCGAHGKQALTMCMGFGCNAAGVVATRVIESPRERLVAIITNNFALCNGRWPTQILIGTIFVGALAPAAFSGLVAAGAVVAVAVLGVGLTFLVSWGLTRTVLKGEVSAFSLELPPYRPPRVLQTIYTSLIDRTVFVLWRAMVFAAPAGVVIWAVANVHVGEATLAEVLIGWLDPVGLLIGLNGIILLAYVVAIPANEIVIPTVLMLTVMTTGVAGVGEGAGVMFELESNTGTAALLQAGGWTLLTAVSLMLFSLVHNPCSTTIYTIWTETRSLRWTVISAVLPVVMGLVMCFLLTQVWRLMGG